MKTKNSLFVIALTIYAYLFYKQTAGINFFIFNLLLIGMSAYLFPKPMKQNSWITTVVGALISSLMIVIQHTNLSIVANIISILLLVGFMYNFSSSIYVSIFHGFLSIFIPFFKSVGKFLNRISNLNQIGVNADFKFKKYTVFFIPILVTIVFYCLYAIANPVFGNLITFPKFKISLGLVSFLFTGWIGLTGFFNPFGDEKITKWDNSNQNILTRIKTKIIRNFEITALKFENKKGVIMLFMLNILILIFNVFDFSFILTGKKLPDGVSYSKYVHEGVNTLIFSILLAISVIIYFFRANQNFYKNNTWLIRLTYVWIFQNVLLLTSIVYKNQLYISEFGLTYKRIGVYVYLVLTLAGLLLTIWKVKKLKTVWYILRKNTIIAYTVLIISCLINWDGIIAHYNINSAKVLDVNYLFNLSDNALPELKGLLTNNKVDLSGKIRDLSSEVQNNGYSNYNNRIYCTKAEFIQNQIDVFISKHKNKDWQSYNYADSQILKSIQ